MIMVVRHPSFLRVTPRINMVRISMTWPMVMTGMIQLPGMPGPPASGGGQKRSGPIEITVKHEGIHQRDDPKHQDKGMPKQFHGFQPGQFFRARVFFRRGVRQSETVSRHDKRGDAGHDIGPAGGGKQRRTAQAVTQHRAEPRHQPFRLRGAHRVPIHQNERERPGGENPTNRSPHPHNAKLFLGIPHVGEGDGVADGHRGDVKQTVQQHEPEERPERPGESQAEDGQPADEMAEREEFFRRETPVGKLVAEEHAHNGGDRKRIQHPGLLER